MRPPIVAVVGHIDHGKSTLLDYIRQTSVVEGEAGGITQHLSAYEAEHENTNGKHRITFLDTPGHEAFSAMRSRGLEVADVAILVVSAEEGVKPQTIEALKLIQDVKIPFIVAITKIDKPGANVEKTKMSLLEHQIFLEGLGGEVPYIPVSGKTGEGIPELLDLILLAGELEGLSADPEAPGEGLVIEAHVDPRRGNTATLIVQNGSIQAGKYVVSGASLAPVRIMENFLGRKIDEALPGSPVQIVGFSTLPQVGDTWKVVENKKEAETAVASQSRSTRSEGKTRPSGPERPSESIAGMASEEEIIQKTVFPLIIKTDVAGTGEAVLHELNKLPQHENLEVRIVSQAVGPIGEADVKLVGGGKTPGVIVGFNVKVEREAKDLAERLGVEVVVFDIIYKLQEWLGAKIEERRPRIREENKTGAAKILKVFSNVKGRIVLGGRVEEGTLNVGEEVRVMRRDLEIARGEITSLQSGKNPVKKIESGEFGAQVKLGTEPAPGDKLEAFEIVFK
ncbi:translation initiation factor IF-2 [Candidatus Parcubacteria bacterium]|nr:translation initiation factor IF-2 [Candidatus Parcubacteria bacterium]